jgi:hypothetical protein
MRLVVAWRLPESNELDFYHCICSPTVARAHVRDNGLITGNGIESTTVGVDIRSIANKRHINAVLIDDDGRKSG